MTSASFRRVRGPLSVVEVSAFGYERRWRMRIRYPSIDEFARRMSYHRHLVVSPQGMLVPVNEPARLESIWQSGLYTSFQVFDEDDVPVPSHVVMEDIAACARDRSRAYKLLCWKRRGWSLPPDHYFRNGPVPGSGSRSRRPKDYKRIGTISEVRRRAWDEADFREEAAAPALRAKRSRSMIGDNDWEGAWSMRANDRSWKRHRLTQWRG